MIDPVRDNPIIISILLTTSIIQCIEVVKSESKKQENEENNIHN